MRVRACVCACACAVCVAPDLRVRNTRIRTRPPAPARTHTPTCCSVVYTGAGACCAADRLSAAGAGTSWLGRKYNRGSRICRRVNHATKLRACGHARVRACVRRCACVRACARVLGRGWYDRVREHADHERQQPQPEADACQIAPRSELWPRGQPGPGPTVPAPPPRMHRTLRRPLGRDGGERRGVGCRHPSRPRSQRR
jgi:hypothetical protein